MTAQTKDQILETLEKMSGLLAGTSKTQVMFPCFLFAPFVFFVFVFVFVLFGNNVGAANFFKFYSLRNS